MKAIILAIIFLPALEIGVFLWFGANVGIFETFLIIIMTGILGAYFAKRQGLKAIKELQMQWKRMEAPGDAILDSLCIFAGGIMLISPGIITDVIGFTLLFTPTRNLIKPFLYRWIQKKMSKGNIIIMR